MQNRPQPHSPGKVRRLLASTLWVTAMLAACTSAREVRDDLRAGVVPGALVDGVPFVRQGPDACGAAALASVLGYLGMDASEAELTRALRTRQKRGAITYELAVEARSHGALAVQLYDVMPETLMRAVDAGVAPVVLRGSVLHEALGRYHYSVLTAYDRSRRVWVAHDGDAADVLLDFDTFDEDHARADRWVLFATSTVLRPTGLPSAVHLDWGVQAQTRGDAAAAAHHYGQAAWTPDAAQALLDLGNVVAADGDLVLATSLLRVALHLRPESAAIKNNLAWTLLLMGTDLEEAERLAAEATQDQEVSPFALDTLQRIREARAASQTAGPQSSPSPPVQESGDTHD